MAKPKQTQAAVFRRKPSRNRPGIHSKKRSSALKSSKNYLKRYKGQG